MYWEAFQPLWKGQTVAILGSGPSMSKRVADSVRHLPRIVLNTTYKLAPDADYIYAGDPAWWAHPDHAEVFDCPGVKVSLERRTRTHPNTPKEVRILRYGGWGGFDDRPGYLMNNGSSGAQALHLAASLGAARIYLLGFDCHGGHWHGPHPLGLGNPLERTYRGWISAFNALAPMLAERGVEVLNLTQGSRITGFTFGSLEPIELAA